MEEEEENANSCLNTKYSTSINRFIGTPKPGFLIFMLHWHYVAFSELLSENTTVLPWPKIFKTLTATRLLLF